MYDVANQPEVVVSSEEPKDNQKRKGLVWVDTSNDYQLKVFDGSSWLSMPKYYVDTETTSDLSTNSTTFVGLGPYVTVPAGTYLCIASARQVYIDQQVAGYGEIQLGDGTGYAQRIDSAGGSVKFPMCIMNVFTCTIETHIFLYGKVSDAQNTLTVYHEVILIAVRIA